MMSFGEAIATCFKKYVQFSGRARRPEYWWFVLFTLLTYLVTIGIDVFLLAPLGLPFVLTILAAIVLFLPGLSVGWRRLHDVGRTGWWLLIPSIASLIVSLIGIAVQNSGAIEAGLYISLAASAISLILSIVLLVFLVSRSQSGPNKYGPEPGHEVVVDG
ncbi:MAG: DUF805 domain-containing protein, partial [Pseudomonadota bacterium]